MHDGDWGMADLSSLASLPVPPPKVSGLPANQQGGEFERNPGTAFGLATGECEDLDWNSGMYVRTSDGGASAIFSHSRFCKYVRLADARVTRQCIHVVGNYYPCWMPVRKGAAMGRSITATVSRVWSGASRPRTRATTRLGSAVAPRRAA